MANARATRLARRLERIEGSKGCATCSPHTAIRWCAVAATIVGVGLIGALRGEPTRADDQATDASKTKRKPADNKAIEAAKPTIVVDNNPVHVSVFQVKPVDFHVEMSQPVSIQSGRVARVYSRISGFVVLEKTAEAGDRVKKGQVLTQIVDYSSDRPADARIQIEKARLKIQNGEILVKRSKAEIESKKQELAAAQAELAGAESRVKFRKVQLDRISDLWKSGSADRRYVDEEDTHFQEAKASLETALAKIAGAKTEVEIAKIASEKAEANLDEAKLDRDIAERYLNRTSERISAGEIFAPFSGIVEKANVREGDRVDAEKGEPLFVVVDPTRLKGAIQIPIRFVKYLKTGIEVSVHFDNLANNNMIRTKISKMDYSVDPVTHTLKVEFEVPDASGTIRPGMYGQGVIRFREAKGAIAVPAQCVRFEESGIAAYCYREVDGVAVKTRVQVGDRDLILQKSFKGMEFQEIVSGLKPGDRIVDAPNDDIDGKKIIVNQTIP